MAIVMAWQQIRYDKKTPIIAACFMMIVCVTSSVNVTSATSKTTGTARAACAQKIAPKDAAACRGGGEKKNGEGGEKKTVGEKGDTKDQARPISLTERVVQNGVFWFLSGLVLGLTLYRLLRYLQQRFRKDTPRVQWLWIVMSVIGAFGHAVFVGTKMGDQWEPVFDTTTLLWLGAAVAGLIYPRISEVTLGTLGFKLTDVADQADALLVSAFAISDKWSTRLNAALVEIPSKSKADVMKDVSYFLAEAAKDATNWLGKDAEARRLAFWLYDRKVDEIAFFLSNDFSPKNQPAICNFVFKSGIGLVGEALVSSVPVNLANAEDAFGFIAIPGDKTKYRGMLLVAIRCGKEPLGVIAVNRSLQERFPDDAVGLITALAAMTGTLLGQPDIRRKLGIP